MSLWLTEQEFRNDRAAASQITLNVAFLQEIKEDNVHLTSIINQLKRAFSQHVKPDPKQLVDRLNQLRDVLETHFALEEFYGYFQTARVNHSHISVKADTLRSQHETIYLEVCELVELAESALYHETDSNKALSAIVAGFHAFVQNFSDHEEQEMELMMRLCNDEIGVGD